MGEVKRSPPRCELRDATLADLPALLALEAQFPGDRLSRRQLRHHLQHGRIRVAEQAGGIAGYHLLLWRSGSRVARLYSIVVADACRGQGIGARLLADAERAAAAGAAAELRLEVRADNPTAIGLYLRHGFRETGRRPGYYDDGEAAVCMRRPIPAA